MAIEKWKMKKTMTQDCFLPINLTAETTFNIKAATAEETAALAALVRTTIITHIVPALEVKSCRAFVTSSSARTQAPAY
jgi:hypothetical protein